MDSNIKFIAPRCNLCHDVKKIFIMMRNKVIYWTSTGIVGGMMLFAAMNYLINPQVAEGFRHLGFPGYLRIELAIAKIVGTIVLLVPYFPSRVKEWAYAGFGIVFISASLAHTTSGDGLLATVSPLVFLGILVISYRYLNIKQREEASA